MRHYFTSVITLLFMLLAFLPVDTLQAQPFAWCPDAGDNFPINAANYNDPGCNMDGVNYGMGAAGVTCTNVVIDVAGIAAAEGYDLDNCNNPILNFTVFQGCGMMATSNTNYYDPFNFLGGGACAEYVAANGALAVPIDGNTTTVTFIVCTTSNNQSIGPVTITGCCTADVTTCPTGGTLTCAQAESFANNPAGLFAFLGGVITITPANCGTVSLSDNFTPGLPCGGTYSVSFSGTFTPTGGTPIALDFSACPAVNVTVNPAPLATATPPVNTSILCSAAPPSPSQLGFSNGLTSACAISGTATSTIAGTHNECGGSYTETWTFIDACNRTSTASRAILVLPAPQAQFATTMNLNILCSAAPPVGTPLAYSNGQTGTCSISGVAIGVITGSHNACGGSYIETWSFTDACNRTSTASRAITVQPAPQATAVNPPGNTSILCSAAPPSPSQLSFSNGLTSSCSISSTVTSTITGSHNACGGSYIETWSFTDACNRTSTASRTITVQPAPLASFTSLPGNISIACNAAPPAATPLSYSNGQTGPCTISGSVTSSITGTNNECGGTYVETWTFTDACGRTITHSRNITVQPAPPAAFTNLPGNITIACATGTPASNPLNYNNGQGGVCSISGSVNSTFTIQNDACPRRYTETWTFTDRCNRTITHSRTVTVNIFLQNANIGAANGSAAYSCANAPGNFGPMQVSSVGYGGPLSDIMHFAYARLSGDGTIIAKFNNATNLGFGGIMFRETLAPGSRKAALRTQNSLNNFQREVRQTTNGVEVTQQWPRLHNWLRMDKIGNVIAAYTSPDGINWWSCPSHTTVILGDCFYVGVFAEGINVNSLSIATFDVVRITGFNQLPVSPLVSAEDELFAEDQIVDLGAGVAGTLNNAGVVPTPAIQSNLELTVFPNPASNGEAISLEMKGVNEENVRISVYSLQGLMIKEFWADVAGETRLPLDLPNIPAGTYLVKAQTADRQFVTKKFTVNRN